MIKGKFGEAKIDISFTSFDGKILTNTPKTDHHYKSDNFYMSAKKKERLTRSSVRLSAEFALLGEISVRHPHTSSLISLC